MKRVLTVSSFLAACLTIWISPHPAYAQPSYFQKYKTIFERSEPGSDKQLDAGFKMVDVIFHCDLQQALTLSEENERIARSTENRAAIAAALMDRALWTAYMQDSTKADPLLKEAESQFDPDGDPRFLCQYYSARFGYSLVNENEEYNPNQYLELAYKTASQTDDPHLLMSYYYMAATSKVFVGKLSPTDSSVLKLREELQRLTEENNFDTGKLNLLLLDAQEAHVKGDDLKCLMIMTQAANFAKEKQYPLFELRAKLAMARVELEQRLASFQSPNGNLKTLDEKGSARLKKTMRPVKEKFTECLELAKQIKMAAYTFETLIPLAFAEFHSGNVDAALAYIDEADTMDYACFRSWVYRDRCTDTRWTSTAGWATTKWSRNLP